MGCLVAVFGPAWLRIGFRVDYHVAGTLLCYK